MIPNKTNIKKKKVKQWGFYFFRVRRHSTLLVYLGLKFGAILNTVTVDDRRRIIVFIIYIRNEETVTNKRK